MIVLGFLFGIIIGVLYFELFSIKHPKTLEEVEMMMERLAEQKRVLTENPPPCQPEQWMRPTN